MSTDPGRPAERTALAWQRTVLATCLAALVLARLTGSLMGPVTLLPLSAALGACFWMLATLRRQRRLTGLGESTPHPAGTVSLAPGLHATTLRDGRLPAAAAVATGLLVLGELAWMLARGPA